MSQFNQNGGVIKKCHGPGYLVPASVKLEPKLQGTPWVVGMHGMWNALQGKQNGAEPTQEKDNVRSGHGVPDVALFRGLFHEPAPQVGHTVEELAFALLRFFG